jgi:hypothetical protein
LAGVDRRLALGGPAEDRHELAIGCTVLRCDRGASFAETVGGAMRELGLVAAIAKPISESGRREAPPELCREEG